jgi:hypothetical protein
VIPGAALIHVGALPGAFLVGAVPVSANGIGGLLLHLPAASLQMFISLCPLVVQTLIRLGSLALLVIGWCSHEISLSAEVKE